jgi:hypothetical protein
MNSTTANALAFTVTLLVGLAICVGLALGFAKLAEFSADSWVTYCAGNTTDSDCQVF